jgi:lipoprotein-anchoring transpeptidase ErfK/SrfK
MGLPLLMAGCATSQYANYGAIPGERFPLPAIPASEVKPELRRTEVAFGGDYAAGTIVVNTPERRLYYVLGNGRAIRYGIGVGRQGLALRGNATIGRKAEWPSWTPTANMMRRDSRNRRYAGGLPGGPNNPLGARALYLYRDGRDTMFRIHHRQGGFQRLHPHAQSRCHRSLRTRDAGHARGGYPVLTGEPV